MRNKKLLLVSLLSLSSMMTLAGCDDVVAKPTKEVYDQTLINETGLTNNAMSAIYDALVTSGDSTSEKVLNNILLIYAKTYWGPFFDLEGEEGLKSVYESGDQDKINAFAHKYKGYQDDKGETDARKVKMFYDHFMKAVLEAFKGYITNSSYQDRSQFYEKKFYDAQKEAYYVLGDEYFTTGVQVDGELRVEEDFTVLDEYFKDIFGTYKDYIERNVLPDIYRNCLVSEYLYKENYRTLGNSSARNIDYIKLADIEAYAGAAENLVKAYANLVIEGTYDASVYNLAYLDDLYKGVTTFKTYMNVSSDQAVTASIYAQAGWTFTEGKGVVKDGSETIWAAPDQSTLGGYLTSYNALLASTDRFSESQVTEIRNDFTGTGAYTIETGLAIKMASLMTTSNLTYGWFTSNSGGLDSFPLKDRLFKLGVANEVDSGYNEETHHYANSNNTYGWYRDDTYFLVPESYETETNKAPYVLRDGSNWYIVAVKEAVKGAKLFHSASEYAKMKQHVDAPYDYTEYIAREVANKMATQDTYRSSANKYFVDKMALTFHDTSIYNYFVKTFPDLYK